MAVGELHKGNWRDTLIPIESSIKDVVQSVESSGVQIVIVIGQGDSFEGTITDGDIRRGYLQGCSLDDPVEVVLQRNSKSVPASTSIEVSRRMMLEEGLRHLPVVDENGRVIGLRVTDIRDRLPERPNLVVIMAGGFGSRLKPYTAQCPKPLLKIAGKPILEHIIERARGEGFRRFVIAVHHMGHMIEEFLGHGERWNVEIDYLKEKTPLGTAGALSLLSDPPSESLLVTNGDVLTDVLYGDLVDFHLDKEALATMAVRLHEWEHPFGVVHTNGEVITRIEEKPTFNTRVNAGIYVLDPWVLQLLEHGERKDMPWLFDQVVAHNKRALAFPIYETWFDIGSIANYESAEHWMTRKEAQG